MHLISWWSFDVDFFWQRAPHNSTLLQPFERFNGKAEVCIYEQSVNTSK